MHAFHVITTLILLDGSLTFWAILSVQTDPLPIGTTLHILFKPMVGSCTVTGSMIFSAAFEAISKSTVTSDDSGTEGIDLTPPLAIRGRAPLN